MNDESFFLKSQQGGGKAKQHRELWVLMQNEVIARLVPTMQDVGEQDYEYLLAFSSDTLAVIDHEFLPVEMIKAGKDTRIFVLAFDGLNQLLDFLLICKNCINCGRNPLNTVRILG